MNPDERPETNAQPAQGNDAADGTGEFDASMPDGLIAAMHSFAVVAAALVIFAVLLS